MDTQRWKRLEDLFIAALEHDPEDRPAFLDEACSNDFKLRQELDAMLSANDESMALALESRLLSEETPALVNASDLIGTHIGPYRLEKLIGEGGMGEVYLAQRDDDQYRQKVALKLVRAGLRNSQIMVRFRMERQVLARLTHPHITQLLDGGIDSAGRPYLVMQYVEGLPITEYCDKHALSISDRLILFRTVCSAVQHAHRNLVVHRDLKPSNILVTEDGVVKLLDFGIAKLLNPDWEMSLAITQSQVRLMTPEYAAPEQIKGEAITTATDVYALGILLYEILSGRRPYRLRNRIQAEVERLICEVDPARPSTAITEASEDAPPETTPEAVSRARKTGISRLKKMLQGDLDNIVLMALRKEPTRRYSSASQLSEDIERYRNGLPVQAQKDSVSYRLHKFVQRHRAGVFFSAVFLALLIAFSAVTAYQGQLLKAERDTARIEKDRAEQVIGLLVSLFETANPVLAPGGDTLSIGEFVKKGAEKILDEVKDDEALSIELKHTLGRMYEAQGQYKEAYVLLQEAYEQYEAQHGKDDSTTTAYLHALAVHAWRMGDISTAHAMFTDLLDRNRRIFGDQHPRIALSMQSLAYTSRDEEEKRALLESSLAMRRKLLPANHMDIAEGLNQLAIYYVDQNRCDKALTFFKESLTILEEILAPNHPNTMAVMGNIATCLNRTGNLEEAITIQKDVIARLGTVASDSSVQMSNAWNNLAVLLTNEGSFEEAEAAFRHALNVQTHLLGETHPRVISTARSLGVILGKLERHEEAMHYMTQALGNLETRGDEVEPKNFGYMRAQYAVMALNAGQMQEALMEGKKAITTLETTADADDPKLADGSLWWSMILIGHGELESAMHYAERSLETRSQILKPDDPKIAEAQCTYGRILAALGYYDKARKLLSAGYPAYAKWPMANPQYVEASLKALEGL